MFKMTAYLGVLVLVTYFSTQVSSQNTTLAPATGNDTTVTMASNTTMMQTNAYTSANTTTPSGASFTRSSAFSILLPVAMAASLVFSRC